MIDILKQLNPKQIEAVSSYADNLMVLAGAGSGKTKVLVHRILWLIEKKAIKQNNFLAVTFTNKAAKEMQQRISKHITNSSLWNLRNKINTFHAINVQILRKYNHQAGLNHLFSILDSDDQISLIKHIIKENNINTKLQPSNIQFFINSCKEQKLRAKFSHNNDFFRPELGVIYQIYEKQCNTNSLVDFGEIILRVYELFSQDNKCLIDFRSNIEHVLLDEFQDTNKLQYDWLKLIFKNCIPVTAVGDDDQSIYSWRGADFTNLKKFKAEFKNCQLIRLEQNYRSTQNILNLANNIISQNKDRIGKQLWTKQQEGEKASLFAAVNEREEAEFIIDKIKQLKNQFKSNDIAVLYRSNNQSRIIEESLLREKIDYKIFGGQRFYERAEIKNIIAYLRFIFNKNDDHAFNRIINLPTRGLGKSSLDKLINYSEQHNISYFKALKQAISENHFSSRVTKSFNLFLNIIDKAEQYIKNKNHNFSLSQYVEFIMEQSGLKEMYKKDNDIKMLARLDNLQELVNACADYDNSPLKTNEIIAEFLAYASLDSDSAKNQINDYISLMTIHAAKGLEFQVIFLVGLEEGLFPHIRSMESDKQLAEERRLCYVGITRAKQKLFLSYAEKRLVFGEPKINTVSRFIKDIPQDLIEKEKEQIIVKNWANNFNKNSNFDNFNKNKTPYESPKHDKYAIGKKVKHKKFGIGIILNHEGKNESKRLQVKFFKYGIKWLIASFCQLD